MAQSDCPPSSCNPAFQALLYSIGDASRPPWIVFNSNVLTGNNDIWKIRSDGSELTQVTVSTADDIQPEMSPDGRFIAFSSDRSGNSDIWVVDAEGGNARQVTTDGNADLHPTWFADQSRIAFQSDRSGNSDIWSEAADGSGSPVQLTTDGNNDQRPVFSTPDTILWTAFRTGSFDIYGQNADGSGTETAMVTAGTIEQRPSPARDDGVFLFNSDASGTDQLWKRNPDGSIEQVTFETTASTFGTFSPDGEEIAYHKGSPAAGLWIQTAAGDNIHLVDYNIQYPRFER